MSNPNQAQNQQNNQQPQAQTQPTQPKKVEMVKCRVISGSYLKARGDEEGDNDVFARVGEIIEVPRKYYEKHIKNRCFDSYQSASGGIDPLPHSHVDATLELVEDATSKVA